MPRMLIWRRHTPKCPHRGKGREFLKCGCPLWADGYSNGKRTYRVSLKTRDMSRALKRAGNLDAPGAPTFEPLKTAVSTFMDHCADLECSTQRKYRNSLNLFVEFSTARKIDTVSDVTVDLLESFRADRAISSITSSKELQTFRQFFGFCFDRRWIGQNIARRIKGPRNIRPNDIEPYTSNEVTKILAACDVFGRGPYERVRARAIILLLRYTALRIGDVAMLGRDRVSWDAERERWRVFIRTEKTGAAVFLPIPTELK